MTGRSQLKLNSEAALIRQAESDYMQFKLQNTICKNEKTNAMVNRVTAKLIKATETYFKMNGQAQVLTRYKWETTVLENKIANALCFPGGKIAVFTGILPIANNEDGLAAILGHEIGHAIAGHTNERMSQAKIASIGFSVVDVVLQTKGKSLQTRQVVNQGMGILAQYGLLLPFSRKHELEADEIGLYLMSIAGYNPSEAPKIWERMEIKEGKSQNSFGSTHPSNEKRREILESLIEKAKVYADVYQPKDNNESVALVSKNEFPQTITVNNVPEVEQSESVKTNAFTFQADNRAAYKIEKEKPDVSNPTWYKIEVAYVDKSDFREYFFRKGGLFPHLEATLIPNSRKLMVVLKTVFFNKEEAQKQLLEIRNAGYKEAVLLEYRNGELFGKLF